MIKFSIIIPNYNKGNLVRQCMESIFNQTMLSTDYEVIVIDDGSNDNSINIINEYDIKLLKTNRLGAGGARNKGFDEANGEYIILLDSDDFFENSEVLEKLWNRLNGEDLVFVRYVSMKNDNQEIIMEDEQKSLCDLISYSQYFCCTLKCFKRSLINDIRYKERCFHEDIGFTQSLMCKAKTMMFFKEPLYVYYKSTDNATVDNYTVRKATDFLQQTLEYFYLADKYSDKKDAIMKRANIDDYHRMTDRLYDWVLNDNPYSYTEFKK